MRGAEKEKMAEFTTGTIYPLSKAKVSIEPLTGRGSGETSAEHEKKHLFVNRKRHANERRSVTIT